MTKPTARFLQLVEEGYAIYGRPKPKPKAEVINFPTRQIEPSVYQAILDAAQERYLQRQRDLEAEYDRSCHRGPGDPDYWGR
jgi:hypothetical protein